MTTWLVPLHYASIALFAGLTLPRLETRLWLEPVSAMSVSAAMAIYSAIAAGMIALTGAVLSLVFVMVQSSATTYSERRALWISRNPVMLHALGVFAATVLYAAAALSGVDRHGSGFVPVVSVWIAIGMLTASVGMFVALIHRIRGQQVNRMSAFTGDQGKKAIGQMYPLLERASPFDGAREFRGGLPTQTVVHHGRPRSIQALDTEGLVRLAEKAGGVIEVLVAVGDTVTELEPLLRVCGARIAPDEREMKRQIGMGEERTFEQDPKYAIRQLVDIAVRALSSAVNDPAAAVQALDRIEELLIRLGLRRLNIGAYCGADGQLRLMMPYPAWEDVLHLAFDEIRYYGASRLQVMRRMAALVSDLISVLPAERHAELRHWQLRLESTVARSFLDAKEKKPAAVEDRQGLRVPGRRNASKR